MMKIGLLRKFLIPILITISTGMGIAFGISYYRMLHILKNEVSESLNRGVHITSGLMDAWLQSRKTDLKTWRAQTVLIEALTEAGYYGKSARQGASEYLQSLENGYSYYDFLFLVDDQGHLIASSHETKLSILNVLDRVYVKKSLNGETVISGMLTSRESGEPVFVISVPVIVNDVPTGVLAGAINIRAFSRLFIDSHHYGKKGFTYIASNTGRIIISSLPGLNPNDPIPGSGYSTSLLAPPQAVQTYTTRNNEKGLVAFQHLEQTDWIFAASLSLEEANREVYRAGTFSLIVCISTLLIIFGGVSWLFRNRILKRLQTMLSTIQSMEAGNFSVRIEEVDTIDEISELTQAFNGLAQKLTDTLSEIKREIQVRTLTEQELSIHRDNLEALIKIRTQELEQEIQDRKRADAILREGEQRLRRQNQMLRDPAMHKALQEGDLETTLRIITEATARTLNIHRVGIWNYSTDQSILECIAQHSLTLDSKPQQHLWRALDHPTFFQSLATERTLSIPDIRKDSRTRALFFTPQADPTANTRSILCVSIWVRGKQTGIICQEHAHTPRQWHMDEINFSTFIADFISLALESAELKQTERSKMDLEERLHRAEKMEALGTLAGGVAHDLNNVLSGIVSYPDLLLIKLPADSPMRAPIKMILESGKKAAAIVQDLLTLARRGVAVTEVTDLNTVIEQYLNSPEHEKLMSFHPDVTIETRLSNQLICIQGSPVHLSKTIMNLVSNAAESMPDGGSIIIATENRYIDRPIPGYDTVAEGDYSVLTVSDAGEGISPQDLERIFEPFYTKKKMGRSGTGLGMAVVWGTVKDHKGYIDVSSAANCGTTFSLYFPISRKTLQDMPEGQISMTDYQGRGETILVIDDVEEQRTIASTILEEIGYRVHTAESGEHAIQFIRQNAVDLIVLDMIMEPGIDGLDTYREILKHCPGMKAVIASGYSETDRVRKTQKLGAGAYIRKPYTIANIGLAVRSELDS